MIRSRAIQRLAAEAQDVAESVRGSEIEKALERIAVLLWELTEEGKGELCVSH